MCKRKLSWKTFTALVVGIVSLLTTIFRYSDLLTATQLLAPPPQPVQEGDRHSLFLKEGDSDEARVQDTVGRLQELSNPDGDWALGLENESKALDCVLETFIIMHKLRSPLSWRRLQSGKTFMRPAASQYELALCLFVREVVSPYGHETWFSLFSSLSLHLIQLQGGEWVCFERVLALIQLEHPELHSYLAVLDTDGKDAVTQAWFVDWFNLTLPASILARVYDRLLAGSAPLACFAGLSLTLALQEYLLRVTDPKEIVSVLVNPKRSIVIQHGDAIISRMVSLWQKHNFPSES